MARRRAAVVDEALDHAVAVMAEAGVGALTVSEVARRTGMRAPSLYKYFPSLHALYDALFARGATSMDAAVRAASADAAPGVDRLRAGTLAFVRWCTLNPALAQLMFWRPVPGFRPSPETFAVSTANMAEVRAQLTEAVRLRQLAPGADGDDALRTFTVLLSGLVSQQMANEPGVPFEQGSFSRLTGDVLDMFLDHHRPRRRT